jgi:photosynthetic reaction center cytochrome c subunit
MTQAQIRKMSVAYSLLLVGAVVLLAGCERPPVDSVQRGFRGTGMEQVYNPRLVAAQAAVNEAPVATPPASTDGPKAKDVFKNVKVLGDLSVGEFTRLMTAMTTWVAPEQGCGYCHNLQDLADDSKYTKVVARRMTEMTQHINADWKAHVGATGVTCYTCHRGNNVPSNVWFAPEPNPRSAGKLGDDAGQNKASISVALASLPYDPFTPYISKTSTSTSADIRVTGGTALPTGNLKSTKQAEHTFGLMMHISKSLGVNCTYCHNTRSFAEWGDSPPQRATAWHGLRMVGDLNGAYMQPLQASFPANRLGPTGDVAKANCATCHQGAYKPLYGALMLKDYPALAGVAGAAQAPAGVAAKSTAEGGVVYFGVGSAGLPAGAEAGLKTLLDALKTNATAKLVISGYHSATGELATNQELAKQRAFAVRDVLKSAAGVDEARVMLEKPQSAQANLAGEDPEARRVEVVVK